MPVLALVTSKDGFAWHFAYVVVIDIVAILWILPQRRSLAGGRFMHYAAALPISARVRRLADFVLLAASDGILFIPFFIALGVVVAGLAGPSAGFHVLVIMTLMWSLLVAQYSVFERTLAALFGVLLADVLLCLALTTSSPAPSWWMAGGALLCVAAVPFIRVTLGKKRPLAHSGFAIGKRLPLRRSIPVSLRIRLKTLTARRGMTGLRLLWAFLVVIGADRLASTFRYDGRTFPTATIALAGVALILAGLYRTLYSERFSMRHYLAALPLRRRNEVSGDLFVVLSVGLLPLAVLIGPMFANEAGARLVCAILAVAYLILLAFLRWPTLSGGRWAVFLGFLTAGFWSGAVMAAVH